MKVCHTVTQSAYSILVFSRVNVYLTFICHLSYLEAELTGTSEKSICRKSDTVRI